MRLTLHKKKGAVRYYWQAWAEGARLWIQQGEVGGRGDRDAIPFKRERPLDEVLAAASREPRADGFAEWIPAEHPSLVVTAEDSQDVTPADLERIREALEQTGNLLPRVAGDDPASFSVVDGPAAFGAARRAVGEDRGIRLHLRELAPPAGGEH